MRWDTCSLTLALWIGVGLARAGETPEELLRQSDITLAPAFFQARVTLTQIEGQQLSLEVFRAGESRTLVQFLDAKERGKYLLKRDGVLWFLSPRAKAPVKLHPSYRLSGGASLDDILGTRYSHEYRILGATDTTDGLVALELQAREPTARHPRVYYFVARASRRPVRIEFRSPSGKATGSVEFKEWEEGSQPRPRRLLVTDMLRPKADVAVEISEVSERTVPDALFDLEDGSARRALERSAFRR